MANDLFAPQVDPLTRPHIAGIDSGTPSSTGLDSSANDFYNAASFSSQFSSDWNSVRAGQDYAIPETNQLAEVVNYWEGLMSSVGQQNALNRDYNAEQAHLNRVFNAQEAEKARNWSERMSNTSYQRAVEDLQKAGLNPILAYQQGGSSTPSPSSASGQSASYNVGGGDTLTSLINAFSGILSSASDVIGLFTGVGGSKTTRKIGFS